MVSGNIVQDITDHLPNFLILTKLSFFLQARNAQARLLET